MPIVMDGVFVPVGREKVNWTEGPREAGLGHDLGAPSCVFARQGEGVPAPDGPGRGLRGRTAGKRETTCGFLPLVNRPLSLQDALRA